MKNFIEIFALVSMLCFITWVVCAIMNLVWFEFDPIWFKLSITSLIVVLTLYLIDKLFYDDTI